MTNLVNLGNLPHTVEFTYDDAGAQFEYIDQRALPSKLSKVRTGSWTEVVDAIKVLAVRGAPAIGISGAAALALYARNGGCEEGFPSAAEAIASARPTAVNLRWAVERCLEAVAGLPFEQVGASLCKLVADMQREDEATNRAIGKHGAALISKPSTILTHCNAGSLATYFYGTALGVVYAAAAEGNVVRVYADETRPVCQGSRLTAWELSRAGIPVTIICDNMAASLMASGTVDAVLVGADRIAANGDTANKIGTYGLAVLAKEHGVPFYVAAPFSTIDPETSDGSRIVIEQRDPREVCQQRLEGVDVYNPAFDVTPARFITKIVTENGAFSPAELAERL